MTYESKYSHVAENALVPYYDESRNKWHCGKVVLLDYPYISLIPVNISGNPIEYQDSEHVLDAIEKMNPDNIVGDEINLILRVVFTNHLKENGLDD